MSKDWTDRHRRTNRLVRALAEYVLGKKTVKPEQLFGLCKLTWITDSYDGDDAAYIRSTKIPALEAIFGRDYSDADLDDIAEDVTDLVDAPQVGKLITGHSGFTNFYKPYRNTAGEWIADNFDALLPLFKSAYDLETDQQGRKIARAIERLPGVPKANHPNAPMRPQYLLTPTFFALDERVRFPIINGNAGVQNLLRALSVASAPLTDQYQSMVGLYGKGGVTDAADLDEAGRGPLDFVQSGSKKRGATRLLTKKPTEGSSLPLKDESDITSLQRAKTVRHRRIHNRITNDLIECLADAYVLLEGRDKAALYDVLIKDYDGDGADLLIEVKSSTEMAHIRMAVGQLFDYWFTEKEDDEPHLAILLPHAPDEKTKRLLKWLEIGVLWFSNGKLKTSSKRLTGLTERL